MSAVLPGRATAIRVSAYAVVLGLALVCAMGLVPAAAIAAPAPATTFEPLAALPVVPVQLVAPDGAADDWYGNSLAVSGDTLLVAAYRDDVGPNVDQGSVYVYVRSGAGWTLQQHLVAPDGATGNEFGAWVDVEGDTALISASYMAAKPPYDPGAAYVFTRSGATWSLQAKLVDPDHASDSSWGAAAVALSGGTALVGNPYDDVGGVGLGSSAVFVGAGSTWTFQTRLTAADGAADDLFGIRVALSGDTALVGAQLDDVGPAVDQGSAYVFTRSGTTWSQQQKLVASDGEATDRFGVGVALSGETALVGAQGDTIGTAAEQGSAYVFARSGTTWGEQAHLLASDGAADDEFGLPLALCGDVAVIGGWQHDVGTAADQGEAYVFARSGTSWAPLFADSAGAAGDHFGREVALEAGTMVIGAELATVDANANQGTVYVYEDAAAPVTSADVSPAANAAGWNKTTPQVTFSATDDFLGVAGTGYRLAGDAAWTPYVQGFLVTTQGETTCEYRSTDRAGNVEATKSVVLRVDTSPPRTRALRAARVVRGGFVTLKYRVDDPIPGCGKARVTIKIRRTSGATVKTIKLGIRAVNKGLGHRFRCTLKPRRYRFFVYATDIAGSAQVQVGSNRLTVR